ncbi:hypothetical protein NM208_g11734 [Fusarium decemcellulare]|uniref:Uncharacterized protein n=1 Tax=Fusarium decemcellulare TaxID=57161 RepID=A0ACC1RUD9_9HYPO|nr:hypothetical protein NM208_g11734 [Fusarium decemcellulare]
MRFTTLLAFWAPVAMCEIHNLTGSCTSDGLCTYTTSVVNPAEVCKGKAGNYAGSGINGRTTCTGLGSPCTYVWRIITIRGASSYGKDEADK